MNISKAFFASEDENYGKYILWPDMTISEAFDAVTYKLGRDFGIKFQYANGMKWTEYIDLKTGLNVMKIGDKSFELEVIERGKRKIYYFK